MPRVLVASNMYPSLANPSYGVFVQNYVEALQELRPWDVRTAVIDDPRKGIYRSPAKYVAWSAQVLHRLAHGRPHVTHVHYAIPTGLPWLFLPRFVAGPFVVTLHGGDFYEMTSRIPGGAILLNRLLKRARRVITVSHTLAQDVGRAFPALKQIDVIHMGVDTRKFSPCAQGSPLQSCDEWVFVGQLIHRKGLDLVLKTLPAFPRARLTVCGSGSLEPTLRSMAEQQGVASRVIWRGQIPQSDLPNVYRNGGISFVPSRSEPLGLVALESMASGPVTVAARTGGLAEVLTDDVDGVHFEADSLQSLKDAVKRVYAMSNDRRAELMRRARTMAEQNDILRQTERQAELLELCF